MSNVYESHNSEKMRQHLNELLASGITGGGDELPPDTGYYISRHSSYYDTLLGKWGGISSFLPVGVVPVFAGRKVLATFTLAGIEMSIDNYRGLYMSQVRCYFINRLHTAATDIEVEERIESLRLRLAMLELKALVGVDYAVAATVEFIKACNSVSRTIITSL